MTDAPATPPPPPSPAGHPASFALDAPLEVARWRPLVHWFLAIPQVFVADVLGQVAGLLSIVSWFTIVFTGRQLEGIARFQWMVLRYEARVWTYVLWLREPYPPFEFAMDPTDPGDDPVRVDVAPELDDRDRLTVGLRFLWIIPALLFAMVVWFAAGFVLIVSWFAVLVLGRWPEGMRHFVVGAMRISLRLSAYGRLVVDEYPPFALHD